MGILTTYVATKNRLKVMTQNLNICSPIDRIRLHTTKYAGAPLFENKVVQCSNRVLAREFHRLILTTLFVQYFYMRDTTFAFSHM